MKRHGWPCLVLLLLCGSQAAIAANVIFSDATRTGIESSLRQDEHAIFYDRNGALYPSSRIKLDETWCADAGHALELLVHGCGTEPASRIAADAGLPADAGWESVQRRLRERVATKLKDATSDGSSLVILIHGFNNDANQEDGTPWYTDEGFHKDILDRVEDPVVLRVYWDGLSGNSLGVGIWGEAQLNARIVGHEFRRLLALLPKDTPVRVLTHSTGAVLIANALGNASGGFGNGCLGGSKGEDQPDSEYCERASGQVAEYAVPELRNLRVAMLIPAASTDTFDRYNKAGQTNSLVSNRLVLGLNRNDSATRKLVLPCGSFGATCMTVWPQYTCAKVRNALSHEQGKTQVSLFNVGSVDGKRGIHQLDDHDAISYQRRREKWIPFMDKWLLDTPQAGDSDRFCPKAGTPLSISYGK